MHNIRDCKPSSVESPCYFSGLDGKLLKTPEDFKRHEVYCNAKILMHQAMIDVLTPTYERLSKELEEMKRR